MKPVAGMNEDSPFIVFEPTGATKLAAIGAINFSGAGYWRMFEELSRSENYVIRTPMSTQEVTQAITHAMLGTDVDDLNILEQITNISEWFVRDQYAGRFKLSTDDSTASIKPVKLPKFKYVSKYDPIRIYCYQECSVM